MFKIVKIVTRMVKIVTGKVRKVTRIVKTPGLSEMAPRW